MNNFSLEELDQRIQQSLNQLNNDLINNDPQFRQHILQSMTQRRNLSNNQHIIESSPYIDDDDSNDSDYIPHSEELDEDSELQEAIRLSKQEEKKIINPKIPEVHIIEDHNSEDEEFKLALKESIAQEQERIIQEKEETEEKERFERQHFREEQDRAFRESLEKDRQKEQQRKEEERKKIEEEYKRLGEEEQKRITKSTRDFKTTHN